MRKELAILSALLFAACESDVSEPSRSDSDSIDIVASVKDLPKCNDKNEGVQIVVKGETSVRVCVDGDWSEAESSKIDHDTVFVDKDVSCKTEELKDKSGYRIVCNGDSVGVVLNVTEEVRDTIVDTVYVDRDTSGSTDTADVETDTATVPTELKLLEGYVQKGPFAGGSMVYLYELTDGHTLGQIGVDFSAQIDRSYRFKFTDIKLPSQYVMLHAEGRYKNEVTGESSDGSVLLRAITDVSKRTVANVNVLTELEIDRVFRLVTQKDMTVKNAKKQALSEISAVFHIDPEIFTSDAEDLDIFGTSDADAALLAISVLLQADLSASELSELLSAITTDMKDDGKWEDAKVTTRIAEWAMNADLYGRLEKIRKNVQSWGLSDNVPQFEKYVRIFWQTELGIGECGESNNGDIVDVSNVLSTAASLECEDGTWSLFEIKFSSVYDASGIAYKVVNIGDQVWTAENMRTAVGNSGDYLTVYCNTGADPDFCVDYGGLYSWGDANTACPSGWHLPYKSDWEELIAFAGNTKEKASTNLRSLSWSQGADRYGFGALPAGYWDDDEFIGLDEHANFWSSTELENGSTAYVMTITSDGLVVGMMDKASAASVRCVKDK